MTTNRIFARKPYLRGGTAKVFFCSSRSSAGLSLVMFPPFDVDLLVCRSASRIVTPKVPPPAIVTTAGTHRGIRTMDDEGKCYGIARAVARGRQAELALAAGGPLCGWPASSA